MTLECTFLLPSTFRASARNPEISVPLPLAKLNILPQPLLLYNVYGLLCVTVPEYEVVRVRRSAAHTADTHRLRLRAFGEDVDLALRRTDGLFKDQLRFWTADTNSSGHVDYSLLPHVSSHPYTIRPCYPVTLSARSHTYTLPTSCLGYYSYC